MISSHLRNLRQAKEDIREAILSKGGDVSSEDGFSSFAEGIISIPTGGGGLELNTSLNLTTDKTIIYNDNITVTATLVADYDDLTPEDIDLHGYLKNATIQFYNYDEGLLLGSATTNEIGVASCDLSISSDTNIYCRFDGTSDYNVCASNIVSIRKLELPTEYYELDYIQGTGTQYIELDYVLQAHDIVEGTVDIQRSGSQYGFIFGARRISATYNCYALFSKFGGYDRFNYARTRNEANGANHELDTKYGFRTENNTCTISKDGVIVDTITSSGTIENCVNNCGVFCANTSSGTGFSPDSINYMKLYDFKIFSENNEYIRYLVPVYRKSDNVVGLYDFITGTFYTNKGTGNFVTPPMIIYEDKCDDDSKINNYVNVSIAQRFSTPATAFILLDASENAYALKPRTPYFVLKEIPELNDLDNYVISADMMIPSTSAFNQIGFGIHEMGELNETYMYRIRGDNKVQTIVENGSVGENTIYSGSTSNIWFTMKVTKKENNFNLVLLKGDEVVTTYTWNIPNFTNPRCGFMKQTEMIQEICYIKNIKVETL